MEDEATKLNSELLLLQQKSLPHISSSNSSDVLPDGRNRHAPLLNLVHHHLHLPLPYLNAVRVLPYQMDGSAMPQFHGRGVFPRS